MTSKNNTPIDVNREIHLFLENLSKDNFRALSNGIGLEIGKENKKLNSKNLVEPQKELVKSTKAQTAHMDQIIQSEKKQPVPTAKQVTKKFLNSHVASVQLPKTQQQKVSHKSHQQKIQKLKPQKIYFKHLFIAHAADLILSTAVSMLILALVSYLMILDSSKLTFVSQVKLNLEQLSLMHIVVSIYVAYGIYFIIFKLMAGNTIGNQLFTKK